MEKKDYFSSQARAYAAFRPTYPDDLYDFILSHTSGRSCAWDCATGNGQVARALSAYYDAVFATDISGEQIARAYRANNISYAIAPADKTDFSDRQFDLITVAQALHWLDTEAFYREVRRTGKPGATVSVWGYSLPSVSPDVDALVRDFYTHTVGRYWDSSRKLVENHYRDIAFPFQDVRTADFSMGFTWDSAHLAGYVSSWSATQRFIKENNSDPVADFRKTLTGLWPAGEMRPVTFPLFARLGKIPR